jgi:predicted aldo/keto reductase-like oxidoreductase
MNPNKPHSWLHTTFPGRHGTPARPVCRLGLASRGEEGLAPEDVLTAVDRGINFLNWCGCGYSDGLSQAVRQLGSRRSEIMVCVQFEARSAAAARQELDAILQELQTDYVDILTFYYVEHASEWEEIRGPGGALEFCTAARREGRVRSLGLTSHQRPLAATIARTGLLDMLMIRYNAAHRGAETEVFPVTDALGLPVVVYTCLRWGALLASTPDDPPGFEPPPAPAWYQFALQTPSVTVALMAPANRQELDEDLTVLESPGPLAPTEYQRLVEHGQRVRRLGGRFP